MNTLITRMRKRVPPAVKQCSSDKIDSKLTINAVQRGGRRRRRRRKMMNWQPPNEVLRGRHLWTATNENQKHGETEKKIRRKGGRKNIKERTKSKNQTNETTKRKNDRKKEIKREKEKENNKKKQSVRNVEWRPLVVHFTRKISTQDIIGRPRITPKQLSQKTLCSGKPRRLIPVEEKQQKKMRLKYLQSINCFVVSFLFFVFCFFQEK